MRVDHHVRRTAMSSAVITTDTSVYSSQTAVIRPLLGVFPPRRSDYRRSVTRQQHLCEQQQLHQISPQHSEITATITTAITTTATAATSSHGDIWRWRKSPTLLHDTLYCYFILAAVVFFSFPLFAIAQGFSSSNTSGGGGEPYRASANLGENVILRCVFDFPDGFRVPYVIQWEKQGIKIPIYIWYDGYPPHIGEGYEGRVGLTGQASLNLSNVRESDQGWYICRVMFLNRPPEPIKNGTWTHLDVLAPPQFRLKPPDVIYVNVGESITLPCEAIGTPTPQINWYKDNRPLQNTANVHILANELRITSIQLNDIGEYRCTSRNREGSISTATKIIIAGPAVITLPPRNMTKLEGDRVEFVCEAKALPSNVTHRWLRNGVEISNLLFMENRVAVKHGTLFINPSIGEDSGRYTCEVSNGIGLPESAEAYLNIEYPARVVYSPTIQYLPLGLSGIVRCFIRASPPFQLVTWTKDRRPFDPNSTPGVITLNNGSLLFNRVSPEHQGIYRCTAYNIHGSSEPSQNMEVLVRDPPIFTSKPNDIYVRAVNEEVSMPCDGSGQPKPNIFWRKSDKSKLSRERSSQRVGNLTIKSLKKEDHGEYECVIENEIASIVASSLLIVNNTTPHTPSNMTVNASYFAATVHWTASYNGGYEQTFHLSYRISDQGDAEWKTISVPPPETTNTFTLYNLQSDTEYEFQVYASNRLGAGLPTTPVRASTKVWSFGEKIYPTDSSGSTYIPTVQKPSGPKPDAPRNLTLEKMAQGWVLSWLAPTNHTIAVAYYRVEYRQGEKSWQYTDPIPYDTAHLFKNLEPNSRYIFRVWAYSILGVGEVSEMIEINLSSFGNEAHTRAITAAIVGSVLVFVFLILVSICIVKVYNKRKRKLEKSYMMVTCPVNGTTSFGDSPVPSKHLCPMFALCFSFLTGSRTFCRRYSTSGDGVVRQQHYDDQYDQYRDYWQRPAFGTRIVAGRASAPLSVHAWGTEGQHQPIFGATSTASADVHHDDAYYWRLRNADHATESIWSGGQPLDDRPLPPPRRRALKNLQYSVEKGLVQPLSGRFKSMSKQQQLQQEREPIVHNYDLTPSNQPSARGSFRSDGSGQSQARRPFSQLSFTGSNARASSDLDFTSVKAPHHFVRSTFHSSLPLRPQTLLPYQQRQAAAAKSVPSSIITMYDAQRCNTSSPAATVASSIFPQSFGSFAREFSSIRTPRHISEHVSASQAPEYAIANARIQSQLRELPALRPIHEPQHLLPVAAQNGHSLSRNTIQPFFRSSHDNPSLRATVPIGRNISQFASATRTLSRAPILEPVPEAIYDIAHPQRELVTETEQKFDENFNSYQNLPLSRQEFIRRPLPLHPNSRSTMPLQKSSELNVTSSESSSEQFEYTREKLLGAVEKVRSGYLLSRGSPFRHSTEDRFSPIAQTPVSRHRFSPTSFAGESTRHKDSGISPRKSASTEVQISSTYHAHMPHYPPIVHQKQQPTQSSQASTEALLCLSKPHTRSPISQADISALSTNVSFSERQPLPRQVLITPKIDLRSPHLQESFVDSSGFISGNISSLMLQPTSISSPLSVTEQTSVTLPPRPARDGRTSSAFSSTLPSPPPLIEMDIPEFFSDIEMPPGQSQLLASRVREPFIEPTRFEIADDHMLDSAALLPDSHLIDKLRHDRLRWRHWQTWQREGSLVPRHTLESPTTLQTPPPIQGRGPMSDKEIYGTIGHHQPQYHSYRVPRNLTVEDMEARCNALRCEFINFRKRQAELEAQRRQNVSSFSTATGNDRTLGNSSSSEDFFESAC